MVDDALTQVSTEEAIRLGLEIDTAWQAQRHHEQIAAELGRELKQEINYRNRLRVKAEAFDRITRMLTTNKWENLDALVAELTETIKKATLKFQLLNAAQKKEAG